MCVVLQMGHKCVWCYNWNISVCDATTGAQVCVVLQLEHRCVWYYNWNISVCDATTGAQVCVCGATIGA